MVGFAKAGGGEVGWSLVWLNRRSLGGLGQTSISTGDSGGEFVESGIFALDLVDCWFTIEPLVDFLSAIVVDWDSLDSLVSLNCLLKCLFTSLMGRLFSTGIRSLWWCQMG